MTKSLTHEALTEANKLFTEVLPKFNWGKAFLSAADIMVLNRTPNLVREALATEVLGVTEDVKVSPAILAYAEADAKAAHTLMAYRDLAKTLKPERIHYDFHASPPPMVGVYMTQRGQTKHRALRFWDGKAWWGLSMESVSKLLSTGRQNLSVPKTFWTYEPFRPAWSYSDKKYSWTKTFISHAQQSGERTIRWGERTKIYSDRDLLNAAIKLGFLPETIRQDLIARINTAGVASK